MSTTDADAERDDAEPLCVFAPSPLLTVTVEHDVHESDQLHVHVGGQGICDRPHGAHARDAPAALCGIRR